MKGTLVTPEEHCESIIGQFSSEFRAKYQQGQREHGGNMLYKPGMLDEAIKEAIDLVCYLYTLRQQQDRGTPAER